MVKEPEGPHFTFPDMNRITEIAIAYRQHEDSRIFAELICAAQMRTCERMKDICLLLYDCSSQLENFIYSPVVNEILISKERELQDAYLLHESFPLMVSKQKLRVALLENPTIDQGDLHTLMDLFIREEEEKAFFGVIENVQEQIKDKGADKTMKFWKLNNHQIRHEALENIVRERMVLYLEDLVNKGFEIIFECEIKKAVERKREKEDASLQSFWLASLICVAVVVVMIQLIIVAI
jgi:hypothetical protein